MRVGESVGAGDIMNDLRAKVNRSESARTDVTTMINMLENTILGKRKMHSSLQSLYDDMQAISTISTIQLATTRTMVKMLDVNINELQAIAKDLKVIEGEF